MNNNTERDDLIGKEDMDVLADIANTESDPDVYTVNDDDDDIILVHGQVGDSGNKNTDTTKKPTKAPAVKNAQKGKTPVRRDARYTMEPKELETLASSTEESIAAGRFGAALDYVFFTAGEAREALKKRLNIRIPIGSADADLPVIATAALIESYLGHEDINGEDIEEKLKLIIESSEDENRVRPSASQVELRVFECVIIMCVQAEQCGNHREMKQKLYEADNSFLRNYLTRTIDDVLAKHRRELHSFYNSVKAQSEKIGAIFEEYILSSKSAMSFPKKFFAETKPVLITAIVAAVLCLASIITYFVTYGSIMSFIATDNFLMLLIIVLEVLFCGGLAGVSWLVYNDGEEKEKKRK